MFFQRIIKVLISKVKMHKAKVKEILSTILLIDKVNFYLKNTLNNIKYSMKINLNILHSE